MSEGTNDFNSAAVSLSRNPLGIIALFIVLVYGTASLVTGFSGSFTPQERSPLIMFMTVFPILVLGVFSWLVSKHHTKLYNPGEVGQENFVQMHKDQMMVAVSLTAAAATKQSRSPFDKQNLNKILEASQETAGGWAAKAGKKQYKEILWVDDNPDNNKFERHALEASGYKFILARTTEEALEKLRLKKFSAIISDMKREEGNHEGYTLLDRMRKDRDYTPLFIYCSTNSTEEKQETSKRGGQGHTNDPQELYAMVRREV